MKLKIVLERSDEGGYTSHVPSLPGCISEGRSKKTALSNIREAIELYLERIEDAENLKAFEERRHEPNLRFEAVIKDLKSRGKI